MQEVIGSNPIFSTLFHLMKQEIFDILNTQHEVLMMCVKAVNEFTRKLVYESLTILPSSNTKVNEVQL